MTAELWLTRVVLDARHRNTRNDLGNVVGMHRDVLAMFPQVPEKAARASLAVLHRLDQGSSGPTLLVQSSVEPDTSRFPLKALDVRTTSLTPLLERLTEGTVVRYRIVANATKRAANGPMAGKRIALGRAHAGLWWAERAERSGLGLEGAPNLVGELLRGRDANDGEVTLRPWRIDGVARVREPDVLVAAVRSGLGRGRPYGCGLLSLALV